MTQRVRNETRNFNNLAGDDKRRNNVGSAVFRASSSWGIFPCRSSLYVVTGAAFSLSILPMRDLAILLPRRRPADGLALISVRFVPVEETRKHTNDCI